MPTVTLSIGTSGRDYSTITAWEADLDNGGVYSSGDDAVGEVYNDSVFDEVVDINGGGTVGLNSILLTVPASERHDGTDGSGARIVRTAGGGYVLDCSVEATVQYLEADANGQGHDAVFGATTGSSADASFHACIGHSLTGTGSGGQKACYEQDNSGIVCIDCLGWHVVTSGATQSAVIFANTGGLSRPGDILNCTGAFAESNSTSGSAIIFSNRDHASRHCFNCFGFGTSGTSSGPKIAFTTAASANQGYNAADDTTPSGTGSLTNLTPSDQVISSSIGTIDLHILDGGADLVDAGDDLVDSGYTQTYLPIDIDGRDRDAEGDVWDIGAHEFVGAGGGPPYLLSRSRAADGPSTLLRM